eukprot:g82670.t1
MHNGRKTLCCLLCTQVRTARVQANKLIRTVRCVETGDEFHSMFEVARQFDTKPLYVLEAIKEGTELAGFHWEHIEWDVQSVVDFAGRGSSAIGLILLSIISREARAFDVVAARLTNDQAY